MDFKELTSEALGKLAVMGISSEVAHKYMQSLNAHIAFFKEAGEKIGVPSSQLELHDDSKFSIDEFPYYARHFHGGGDPDGFAKAWLHHIHYNPHHWQHWIFPQSHMPRNAQNVEAGGVVEMPPCYALEMVADWMGASMAYTGSWDIQKWLWDNMPKITIHSKTAVYLRDYLDALGYADTVYIQKFAQELKQSI